MSLLKTLLVHLFSFIFVTTTLLAISSFTIKDSFSKEAIQNFVATEIAPGLIASQCDSTCGGITQDPTLKSVCVQECMTRLQSETNNYVNDVTGNIYGRDIIFGLTLDDLINIMSSYILFAIVAVAAAVLIYVIAEEPFKVLGHSSISVGVSLIIFGLLPQLLPVLLSVESDSLITKFLQYGLQGPYLNYGIVFLITGGILLFIKRKK